LQFIIIIIIIIIKMKTSPNLMEQFSKSDNPSLIKYALRWKMLVL
jgi:hypothetical protein